MNSRWTWLYVAEHEHGYYKIGRSDNPRARVSQLQVGSPYEVDLWLMGKFLNNQLGDTTQHLEDRLHNYFNSDNVRGEWFEADRDEIYQYLAKEKRDECGELTSLVNYSRELEIKKQMKESRFGTYRGPL